MEKIKDILKLHILLNTVTKEMYDKDPQYYQKLVAEIESKLKTKN